MHLKIVDIETAKLLNELDKDDNFNTPGIEFYAIETGELDEDISEEDTEVLEYLGKRTTERTREELYPAPTQELAKKFLRSIYRINIEIESPDLENQGWSYSIHIVENLMAIDAEEGFQTYEQALEKGLKQACEYLKDGNK